jgi:hypothetical protein
MRKLGKIALVTMVGWALCTDQANAADNAHVHQIATAGMKSVRRAIKKAGTVERLRALGAPAIVLRQAGLLMRAAQRELVAPLANGKDADLFVNTLATATGYTQLHTTFGRASANERRLSLQWKPLGGQTEHFSREAAMTVEGARADMNFRVWDAQRNEVVRGRTTFDIVQPVPAGANRHLLAERMIETAVGVKPVPGTTLVVKAGKKASGELRHDVAVWHPVAEGKHRRIPVSKDQIDNIHTAWSYINRFTVDDLRTRQ